MSVTKDPEKNKAIIVKLYEYYFNTGKLDVLNQIIDKDYIAASGEKGPSALAEIIHELRHGFPDIKWTVKDMVAEGDQVAVRVEWHGTHKNTFKGFPASQKEVITTAFTFYRFENDKIASSSIETDRLGFLQQIGVLPADLRLLSQSQERN